MSSRTVFAGGLYAFALPDGGWGVLYPGSHIQTSDGRVSLPDEDVLFLVGYRFAGQLFLAGQGQDTGTAWLHDGDHWRPIGLTFGVSPCAFGDQAFYIVTAGDRYTSLHLGTGLIQSHQAQIGTQGIRYVENGVPVSGDSTYTAPGAQLHEYTVRGDVIAGQGHDGGCLVNGRVLEPGDWRFVRFERVGDTLAIACVSLPHHEAALHWLTVAEIASLPLPSTPVPPKQPTTPTRPDRFWFGPNIGSKDEVRLFDDPAVLKDVGVFSLYAQNILNTGPEVGPNTFEALQANHAFAKLKQAGIALAIEGASLSDLAVVEKIRAVGGDVQYFSYSEPLTIGHSVDQVVTFIKAAKAFGVQVVWIEAWPANSLDQIRTFLADLTIAGATPAYLHLDIDRKRAAREHKGVEGFIRLARLDLDVPVGVLLWGDDASTDAEYAIDTLRFANTVLAVAPDLAHVCVQSWAKRVGSGAQDIPLNLGASGLLASLHQIVPLFPGTATPAPVPIPVHVPPKELTDMIAYAPPVAGFLAGEFAPHPNGDGVIVVKPNGMILCVTPDGSVEERPRSNAGAWERFRKGKSALIAERDGGKVYVLPFAEA